VAASTLGLGKGLHDRGYKIVVRETLGEFQKYSFQDKIDVVANTLKNISGIQTLKWL
jgi:hypothetical protein